MEKLFKSEAYLFFIAIILYMLVIKAGLPNFVYLFYSTILVIYFFPIKIALKFKTEKPLPLIISSYSIAWFLTYANIIPYIDVSVIWQIGVLVMSLINLFLLYYFYKKKNDSMALHLLAFGFIPMIM